MTFPKEQPLRLVYEDRYAAYSRLCQTLTDLLDKADHDETAEIIIKIKMGLQ